MRRLWIFLLLLKFTILYIPPYSRESYFYSRDLPPRDSLYAIDSFLLLRSSSLLFIFLVNYIHSLVGELLHPLFGGLTTSTLRWVHYIHSSVGNYIIFHTFLLFLLGEDWFIHLGEIDILRIMTLFETRKYVLPHFLTFKRVRLTSSLMRNNYTNLHITALIILMRLVLLFVKDWYKDNHNILGFWNMTWLENTYSSINRFSYILTLLRQFF